VSVGSPPSSPEQRPPARGLLRISFEWRVFLGALLVALPGFLVAALVIASSEVDASFWWVLMLFAALTTLALAASLRRHIVFPLYTLSNLLEALREGDFSLRGSRAQRNDAIGDVVWEVNALSRTLRDQRLRAEEASALLAKVIESIDIALFSFDAEKRLQLINAAGLRLLGRKRKDSLGVEAGKLGLGDLLEGDAVQMLQRGFGGAGGRFEVRRHQFREAGLPQELLVVTDLSRALREEERLAWQRLIRVLGHELNNSLAPIRSMAGTLAGLVMREPPPPDWRDDMRDGLRIIGERAESLSRFMIGYATLARLPAPSRRKVDVATLVRKVASLEQRVKVQVEAGEPVELQADPDQLEQALINLVKNAVEASQEGEGRVSVRWQAADNDRLRIEVLDDGLGLATTDNLFVPFFTTKPGGSGIGLVLARQIAEGHGGSLLLENRSDARGCVARIELPSGG